MINLYLKQHFLCLLTTLLPWFGMAQSPLHLLKDILPGTGSSDPEAYTILHNQVYFMAKDAPNHLSLWSTDGTQSGTNQVFYIPDTLSYQPQSLVVKGDSLYFLLYRANSLTMWVSDGTVAGTQPLFPVALPHDNIGGYTVFQGKIWFVNPEGIGYFTPDQGGFEIVYTRHPLVFSNTPQFLYWFERKTLNAYISEIYAYRADGQSGAIDSLGLAGKVTSGTTGHSTCYFSLQKQGDKVLQSVQNIEYDGPGNAWPSGGFVRAEDMGQLTGNNVVSAALSDSFLLSYSNTVWSPFNDPINKQVSVARKNGATESWEVAGFSSQLIAVQNRVFMPWDYALWVTDGTETGTQFVKEFNATVHALLPYGNKLLFYTKENGTNAIWVSDGTQDSTFKIVTLPYLCPFDISNPLIVNGCKLVFTYKTPDSGNELWAVDLPPCMSPVSALPEVYTPAFSDFQIVPNPVSRHRTHLVFETGLEPPYQVTMTDAAGKLLWQKTFETTSKEIELPAGRLSAGAYWVTVQKDGQQTVKKMILER